MIYSQEDLKAIRTMWLPAIRSILEVSRPFTNYGVGLLDPVVCTEADPVPVDHVEWLVEHSEFSEPMGAVDRISVVSISCENIGGELWGVVKLSAPLAMIDKLVAGFDAGNLLVLLGNVGKKGKKRYVTVAIDAVTGVFVAPGTPIHIGFMFDPDCIETKES